MQSRVQRSAELKSERGAVVREIAFRLHCGNSVSINFPTPAALAAADGQLVPLYDRNGDILIGANPTNPTRMGQFLVRVIAHTTTPPLGFEVQVAQPPDPMSPGTPTDFGTPASRLYSAGAYPCAASFVAGCITECPPGSVVRGVDPDTQCVRCANVTCAAGSYYRGIDANGNPLCSLVPLPCPGSQVRVGTDCHEFSSSSATSIVQQVRSRLELECRHITSSSPTSGGTHLQCANDEFLMNGGGRCVDAWGDSHWGNPPNDPGHNPDGLAERFSGYIHTNQPESISHHRIDCYYNPFDVHQGRSIGAAICCKRKMTVHP
jgi:hypothetical protein